MRVVLAALFLALPAVPAFAQFDFSPGTVLGSLSTTFMFPEETR